MTKEKQKIQNIFNPKIKLKNPSSREKQDKIKKLLIETTKIEGKENDNPK